MTCQTCRDLLSALIDRELSEAELKAMWAHLHECPECAQECVQLCCMDAAAAQACCPEVSGDLWEQIGKATGCCVPQPQEERAQPPEDILLPEEAARYLRLSVGDLLDSLDALPHFEVAGQVRFRRSSLEQWIEAQERASTVRIITGKQHKNVVHFAEARGRMSRVGRM